MVALSFSLLSSLPANPFLGFEFNFSSVPGKAMCFKKNCIFLAVKCVPLYVSTKHFTDCSSYSHPFLSLSCLTSALLDSPSCQSSCGLPGHGHDQTTSADIPSKDASPLSSAICTFPCSASFMQATEKGSEEGSEDAQGYGNCRAGWDSTASKKDVKPLQCRCSV